MSIQEALTVDLRLRIGQWNKALQESANSAKAFNKKVVSQNKKMGKSYVDASGRMRDANGKFVKGAEKGFGRVNRSIKKTSGALKGLRSGFVQLAIAAGGASFFGSAINSAREFDRAMREVITIVPEGSKTFQELSAEVQEVAILMGEDAPKAARAMYQAISAGVDAKQAKSFLVDASTLAKAGVTSLETSVDLLTSTMNAYGISIENADALSDVFFKTVQLGKTTVQEMSSAIGQVAPIASSAGIKVTEVGAAFAALTASGVSTAEASTQFKSFVSAVVSSSSDARAAAKSVGFELSATALRAKGLPAFMQELKEKTGGNIETMARIIPNIRGLGFALSLTGKGAEKFASSMEQINKSSGAAAEGAKKVGEGFDFQLKQLEASFSQGMIGIGKTLVKLAFDFEKTGNQTPVIAAKIAASFKRIQSAITFVGAGIKAVKTGVVLLKDVGSAALQSLGAWWNKQAAAIELIKNRLKLASLAFREFVANRKLALLDPEDDSFRRKFREITKTIAKQRKERKTLEKDTLRLQRIFRQSASEISMKFDRGIAIAARKFKAGQKEIKNTWDQAVKLGIKSNQMFEKADKLSSKIAKNSAKIAKSTKDIDKALTGDDDNFKAAEALRKIERERQDRIANTSTGVADLYDSISREDDKAFKKQQDKIEKQRLKEERERARAERQFERDLNKGLSDSFRAGVDGALPSIQRETQRAFEKAFGGLGALSGSGGRISNVAGSVSFSSEAAGRQALIESNRNARRSLGFSATAGLLPGDLLNNNPLFFSKGGMVPGPNTQSDSVSARVTPGEYVVNRQATSAFLPLLQAINRTTQTAPAASNTFNFGDINAGSNNDGLSDDVIDKVIAPRIAFLLRMKRLGA